MTINRTEPEPKFLPVVITLDTLEEASIMDAIMRELSRDQCKAIAESFNNCEYNLVDVETDRIYNFTMDYVDRYGGVDYRLL